MRWRSIGRLLGRCGESDPGLWIVHLAVRIVGVLYLWLFFQVVKVS